MPLACVLAQSIPQFTPWGQSLKNIRTAPRSRVVLRAHVGDSGMSATHGSVYASVQVWLAAWQSARTTSTRRTYPTVRSWPAHSVTVSAGGSAPLIWQ